MPYLCLQCGEVYNISLPYCPKVSCHCGDVVEIDDLMLPIISMLNEKGYITRNCCSGHAYDDGSSAYIQFDPFITLHFRDEVIEKMAELPDGWEIEESKLDKALVLRYTFKLSDMDDFTYAKQEAICNANLSMLDFVQDLEYLDYVLE